MTPQPLLLLRPLPPLENHEVGLRVMPHLEAKLDKVDAMIELLAVLFILAACVAGYVAWRWV